MDILTKVSPFAVVNRKLFCLQSVMVSWYYCLGSWSLLLFMTDRSQTCDRLIMLHHNLST